MKKTDFAFQKKLQRFLRMVDSSGDTPALIQQVARERFFMKCCAAVVKGHPQKTPALWALLEKIQAEARRQLYSFERIEKKLAPVAMALGLGADSSDSLQVDYYDLLGVDKAADNAAIKKAYRSQARHVHPDMSNGENDRFLAVHEAYEVLSDPALRGHYDDSRAGPGRVQWQESANSAKHDAHDFRDERSALRKYGFQLSAIVIVLVGITLAADQMIRDESLRQKVYLTGQGGEGSGQKSVVSGRKKEVRGKRVEVRGQKSVVSGQKAEGGGRKVENEGEGITEPEALERSEFVLEPVLTSEPEKLVADFEEIGREPVEAPRVKKPLETEEAVPPETEISAPPAPGAEKQQVVVVEATPPDPPAAELKDRESHENHKDQPEMEATLSRFLHQYCRAYEEKDLQRFLNFFADSATENGKQLSGLIDQYRKNFEQLAAIDYNIDMVHYTWDTVNDQVEIDGGFELRWKKKSSGWFSEKEQWHSYDGTIEMQLNKNGSAFRIEQLNYRFNGER